MNIPLSTEEAAVYLRISVNTLANWRSQNKGPRYYNPSGKVLYYKKDLDEWIKGEKDE